MSCIELQSLLRVVNYTKEGNWKAILSIEDPEAHTKAIRTAAKEESDARRATELHAQ